MSIEQMRTKALQLITSGRKQKGEEMLKKINSITPKTWLEEIQEYGIDIGFQGSPIQVRR